MQYLHPNRWSINHNNDNHCEILPQTLTADWEMLEQFGSRCSTSIYLFVESARAKKLDANYLAHKPDTSHQQPCGSHLELNKQMPKLQCANCSNVFQLAEFFWEACSHR
jgi:hypothetical protein